MQLLAEPALLAPGLTVRQWVAHSGLDPAHHDSGTSVHKAAAHQHSRKSLPAARAFCAGSGLGALRSAFKGFLRSSSNSAQNQTASSRRRRPQTASCHLRHLQD